MPRKCQRLTERLDCNREAFVEIDRQLSSIYDADSSRPLSDRFARLLNQIGQAGPQDHIRAD
jgi:hypothetical protein